MAQRAPDAQLVGDELRFLFQLLVLAGRGAAAPVLLVLLGPGASRSPRAGIEDARRARTADARAYRGAKGVAAHCTGAMGIAAGVGPATRPLLMGEPLRREAGSRTRGER